ncbi:MAG: type II/IV secretion system protein [Parcubacteria group bacterium]|nr:type II/IV secretion system protein [Parcubacteria group bacterium]
MDFLNYLIQRGIIDKATSEKIARAAKESGKEIPDLLIEEGIEKENVLSLKGDYLQIPSRSVDAKSVPPEILKYIPEESVAHYEFAPIGMADGVLEVGMVDPDNLPARDALQFIATNLGIPFKIFLITRDDFEALLENYRGLSGEVREALTELGEESIDLSKPADIIPMRPPPRDTAPATLPPQERAKPLRDAAPPKVDGGASDIHIEHTGEQLRVRFRVDGVLYTSLLLPKTVHDSVVARIKVLSNLKLDERRKPQDGSFTTIIEGRKVDFRVSTFPAYFGEKIVIRILDPEKGVKRLEETGLRPEDLARVRAALEKPYGLILLTGPTGSGKSTTLYSMLNELDREKDNVVSLEDPVEYTVIGVSQSQVRPEIDYTFATGLRSIVRQDPDIIMVGEIRDKETAQLAIQAALTGHLVFSTLHTNNAAGVIPRLVEMGIEPYLIALTLILAIAQRLVPVMCESSKKSIPVTGAIKAIIEKQFEEIPPATRSKFKIPKEVFEAIPSEECPGGTRGRVGVFELLEVDKDIEEIILRKPAESEMLDAARAKGMLTMKDDALLKAFEGVIPIQAVNQFE